MQVVIKAENIDFARAFLDLGDYHMTNSVMSDNFEKWAEELLAIVPNQNTR